jgi:hypothetical protein
MKIRSTTILAVRRDGKVAVAGDGQVTLQESVIKHHAKKVRRIYNDKIIVGFAGAAADALNLSERLEAKLERYNGNLMRSAVELARDWRTDKLLRRLEAVMIADPRVRKTPRPSVWVLDLSNGCVQLGGRCWADNPKYWSTRVDLIEKAKLRFDYEGIVISYPHLGVHPFNTSAEDDAFQEKMATGRLPRSPEPVEDEM